MFAENAFVNDPVGTPAHTGKKELFDFYKVFLEPSDVQFTPSFAFAVNSPSKKVIVKYVDITATTTATGSTSTEPAMIL